MMLRARVRSCRRPHAVAGAGGAVRSRCLLAGAAQLNGASALAGFPAARETNCESATGTRAGADRRAEVIN